VKKQIFAVLAFVNGDNLARHALFGLNENFSLSKKPCSTCSVSHEELQTTFIEEATKMVCILLSKNAEVDVYGATITP
jgi:hypothetical protein